MAKTTVGRVSAIFTANTDAFEKGVRRAERSTHMFSKGANRAAGAVRGYLGVLAGGVGTAALTSFVKGQMDAIDELAKVSDRIGITTKALAGMQLHAELAGVGTEALNTSLTKMQRTISDATFGMGAGVKALQQLGLSATQLSTMSPDEQFLAISDALENIPNQADRVATAMALAGRGGAPLVNMLMEGRPAIEAAAAEAEKFGLAISRVDAAQVEEANDAIERAGMAWSGIGRTIAVELSPTITALADQWTETAVSGREDVEAWSKSLDPLAKAYHVVTMAVAYFRDGLDGLSMGWDLITIGATKAFEFMLVGMKKLISGIVEVNKFFGISSPDDLTRLKEYEDYIEQVRAAGVKMADDLAAKFSQPTHASTAEASWEEFLAKRADAVQDTAERIKKTEQKAETDKLAALIEAEEKRVEIFRESDEKIIDLSEKFQEKMKDNARDRFENERDYVKDIQDLYSDMYDAMRDFAKDEAREIEDLQKSYADLVTERDEALADLEPKKRESKKEEKLRKQGEIEADFQKGVQELENQRMRSLQDRNEAMAEKQQEFRESVNDARQQLIAESSKRQEDIQLEQLRYQMEMVKLLRDRSQTAVAA